MTSAIRVGIVADYDPKNKYHVATEQSIAHAAEALGITAEALWMDTDTLDKTDAEARLAECDAIWCGTSSPYRSMEGALRAIRFAREQGVPFRWNVRRVSTCSGRVCAQCVGAYRSGS